MCIVDSISDLFNRIRLGQHRRKEYVSIFYSKKLCSIVDVLYKEGYVSKYETDVFLNNRRLLKIHLKYFKNNPVIAKLQQVSKQSLRIYCKYKKVPIILNGLGTAILSTSQGVLSGKDAKVLKVGGEFIGFVV